MRGQQVASSLRNPQRPESRMMGSHYRRGQEDTSRREGVLKKEVATSHLLVRPRLCLHAASQA